MSQIRISRSQVEQLYELFMYERLGAIVDRFEGGETRFWVHDSVEFVGMVPVKDSVTGEVMYEIDGKTFCGIVDEKHGGIIAWGTEQLLEELCETLMRNEIVTIAMEGAAPC